MQLMGALHLSSSDVLLSLFGKCLWFFGWIWLVDLLLEFGRLTSSGWIDESSVAPACGEKPWPFADRYKLANSFGSMLSLNVLRPPSPSSASVSLSVWSSLAPVEISLTWNVWVSYFGNHPMLYRRRTEQTGCTTLEKGSLLKFATNRLRAQCFVLHWFPSHCFKLYHKELYLILISLLVASEDIRCQSYISSKALFRLPSGPEQPFLTFLYMLWVQNSCVVIYQSLSMTMGI